MPRLVGDELEDDEAEVTMGEEASEIGAAATTTVRSAAPAPFWATTAGAVAMTTPMLVGGAAVAMGAVPM